MTTSLAAPATATRWAARPSLVALVALALALAGVLTAPGAWAAAAPGQAWVRAAHAVPGLEGMAFTVTGGPDDDTVTLVDDAEYGSVSDYEALAPGDYTASVAPAGEAEQSAVLVTSFTVGQSSATTLAAIGTTDQPRLATLSDDLTPPAAGTANVRVLPAAAAAPTVTVEAQDGPTITDVAVFGQATAYAPVPAGRWALDLSGGRKDSKAVVDVEAGNVYTLVVVDGEDGALEVLPVTDAAGTSQPGAGQGGAGGPAATAPGAAAPVGGVQTGGGGTATATDGVPPTGVALSVGALVLGALLVRRRVGA